MVLPRRIRDQDGGARVQRCEEIGANFQRAGATEALCRDDTALRDGGRISAEDQFSHQVNVVREAIDAEIGVWFRGCSQPVLGGVDAIHQRQVPVLIEVDADPEVHLGCALIRFECLGQSQDRISRSQADVLENGHVWASFCSTAQD